MALSATVFIVAITLTVSINAFDDAPALRDPGIPTRAPHATQTSDSCVGQCAFSFMDSMRAELGDTSTDGSGVPSGILNLNYNDFLSVFTNATFFEKFCELYHKFNYCYTQCPHGYMQELLQRSAEIVDHFCVYNYKAITEKFGCLSTLDREVSKTCLKTCTSHHDAVTSLMHNFRQLALNGDSSQAENYLSESCEYVICTLHCDVPHIAHICDFETAELVINLTKKSFDSMQRMALDTGAVSKWPAICLDIKNYALPKATKIPPISDDSNNGTVIAQSPSVVLVRAKTVFADPRTRQSDKVKMATTNATDRPQLWWWPMVIAVFVWNLSRYFH